MQVKTQIRGIDESKCVQVQKVLCCLLLITDSQRFWYFGFNWLNFNPSFFFALFFFQVIYPLLYKWTWKLLFWFYDLEFWWGRTVLFCLTSVCREPDDRYGCRNLIRNPLCLSLQENDDLLQRLTSNKVLLRVLGLDLRAVFVCSTVTWPTRLKSKSHSNAGKHYIYLDCIVVRTADSI